MSQLPWVLPAAAAWLALLAVPWRPWSTRERLEPERSGSVADLGDVVVLIPARDEAVTLPRTLQALARQGSDLAVVLVDDRSSDGTAAVARTHWPGALTVIEGRALPSGWSGKVWAQAQGAAHLDRPLALLLDADIALGDGVLPALRARLLARGGGLASVMATLRTDGPWSRLLLPAFVYFFKLLYPFRLVADPGSRVAGAAGGCILLETRCIEAIGGFEALRGALIDDCALAGHVKRLGVPIWLGLSHAVRSARRSEEFGEIRDMVARTAYTQLRCSPTWLLGCTAALILVFVVPVLALALGDPAARGAAIVALGAMAASYAPTLRFYRLSPARASLLPIAGFLFLWMTWISALRHWRGEGARWRGRQYGAD